MMSRIAARATLSRMVEAHAMQHARAAVVAGGEEAVEAERRHHLDLVLRHGAERIAGMIVAARRLFGIAVAAQIGATTVNSRASGGATLCHDRCVNGLPCISSSGGPLPPVTVTMRAPQVLISVRVKPSSIAVSCCRLHDDASQHNDTAFQKENPGFAWRSRGYR